MLDLLSLLTLQKSWPRRVPRACLGGKGIAFVGGRHEQPVSQGPQRVSQKALSLGEVFSKGPPETVTTTM